MSLLQGINPFPTQPPQQSQQEQSNKMPTAPGAETQTRQTTGLWAVTPAQGSSKTGTSRGSTSYAGTGAGAGYQEPPVSAKFAAPPRATPGSIVNAQVAEDAPPQPAVKSVADANAAAIEQMQERRELAMRSARNSAPEEEKVLPRPPLMDMPDPLPTSPYLKPARVSV